MQPVPDPYRLLGISRSASAPEIKAAHRTLAKRYHPDALEGDTERFLEVQAAYQLLADPLRRRDWDARHAGGPVRADDPGVRRRSARAGGAARGRGRPSSAGGASDRAAGASDRAEGWSASGRDASSRTYTWSASGVPWWEDAGRRPPRGPSTPRTEPAAGPPAGPAPDPPEMPRSSRAGEQADVYSRSSGAAWSSAARAHFRKASDDLPRGRRAASARDRSPLPHVPRPQARPSASAAPPVPSAAASPKVPASATPGPALDTALARRLAEVAGAWLPVALLVGYGGGALSGCDRAAVTCSSAVAPVQLALMALALLVFALRPRLAFAGAAGSASLTMASLGLFSFYFLIHVETPLRQPWLGLALVVWVVAYAAGMTLAGRAAVTARPARASLRFSRRSRDLP